MVYISKNEKETSLIAKKLADEALPGSVFALSGDLGTGKTTFVQAFAEAIGIKEHITSPTFVIAKEYKIPKNKHNKTSFLIHIDCYRIESLEDAESAGLSYYLERNDAILMIEWPEKILKILPPKAKRINFELIDQETRKIEFEF